MYTHIPMYTLPIFRVFRAFHGQIPVYDIAYLGLCAETACFIL